MLWKISGQSLRGVKVVEDIGSEPQRCESCGRYWVRASEV